MPLGFHVVQGSNKLSIDLDLDYGLEAESLGALERSRFLKGIGGAVIGLMAAGVVRAKPAYAHKPWPPWGCGPTGECACCNEWYGCCAGCSTRYSGCGSYGIGWYICSGGWLYFCGDYWDYDGHARICRTNTNVTC